MIFLSTLGGKKRVSGMLLPLKLKVRQIILVTSLKTACIPPPSYTPSLFLRCSQGFTQTERFFLCFDFLRFNKTPITTAAAALSRSASMAKRRNCVYSISLN